MKTMVRFKKGDMVRIVNPNNHFYDEVAEVLMFDQFTNKYLLQFNNGYKCEMYHYDMVKHFTRSETRDLQLVHLDNIINIALDIGDKDWFDKACLARKRITGGL